MVEAAAPVLRAVGARLGPEREVVYVPGNHDAALIRPWLRAHGVPRTVDAPVPLDATPLLAEVTSWLRPAAVRVHYPGVWLADGVWATHGHYLDRHLLPESAFGIARGALGRLPRDRAEPADYEVGPSMTRLEAFLTRWLPRPLAALADDVAEGLRALTMPAHARRLRGHLISPLTALLLGRQMERASIPALARVVHRLGVDAEHVIFGHVHRLGPLAWDDPARWQSPGGRPRIANTGAWVHEPLRRRGRRRPARGGAAGPPRRASLAGRWDYAAAASGARRASAYAYGWRKTSVGRSPGRTSIVNASPLRLSETATSTASSCARQSRRTSMPSLSRWSSSRVRVVVVLMPSRSQPAQRSTTRASPRSAVGLPPISCVGGRTRLRFFPAP
jgi:hypothetical protein